MSPPSASARLIPLTEGAELPTTPEVVGVTTLAPALRTNQKFAPTITAAMAKNKSQGRDFFTFFAILSIFIILKIVFKRDSFSFPPSRWADLGETSLN